ncbi:MAG: hypothetical protein J0L84_18470, partial [Verrucomicrobia bacterium]|nr:hypothetical protein [Verrucomicrobiota bacterium]
MFQGGGKNRCLWTLALTLITGTPGAWSQGSKMEYEQAAGLARRTENTVFRQRVRPQWMPGGRTFWYRVATGPDAAEFVFVDAETGVRKPLMDAAALAQALGSALGTPLTADRLPLREVTVDLLAGDAPAPSAVQFDAGGRRWTWDLGRSELREEAAGGSAAGVTKQTPTRSRPSSDETRLRLRNESREDLDLFWLDTEGVRRGYGRLRAGQERSQHTFVGHVFLLTDREGTTVAVFEATEESAPAVVRAREDRSEAPSPAAVPPPERLPGTSPDGRWIVEVRDHNLHLRRSGDGTAVALSADGSAEAPYRE